MDKALKNKWIKALQSGKYEQTIGKLHRRRANLVKAHPVGYCCLGVLCEIANIPIKSGQAMPRKKQLEKLGLQGYEASKLAGMNDDRMNFKLIAQYIKDHI